MRVLKIVTVLLLITACQSNLPELSQNPNNTQEQKTITKTFSGIIENSQETWYYSNMKQTDFIEITDYTSIDSITFQAGLRTPYGNVTCFVDLYDIEARNSIYGSELKSSIPYFVNQLTTPDLSYYFKANKKYRLALRIKTSQGGVVVQSGYNSYLTIYYKE